MKPINTSTYTFSDLIQGGFLYVDKTKLIHKLIALTKGQYFLSRPRRFGKSLLVSTLKAIFSGKRELFKGLAISDTDYDWQTFPIIHLDFGSNQVSSAKELTASLKHMVKCLAKQYAIHLETDIPHLAFQELIEKLARESKVIILIDEYDKPILGNIHNIEIAEKIKNVLKSFYSVIKTTEQHQRFALLTGVSKFSKVSIFSDLNNLTDITLDSRYATLLGYTQEEIELYFTEPIDGLVQSETTTKQEMLDKISNWYNGYRFSRHDKRVYNPVSVMRLFDTGEFASYWFETGTPSFLINLLKTGNYEIQTLDGLRLTELGFSSFEVDDLAAEPLLFQTGYITIKDFDPISQLYTLSYPNREVFQSFTQHLAGAFTPVRKELAPGEAYKLVEALRTNNVNQFMKRLKIFFADIDYDLQIQHEKYYQTIFFLVLRLIGLYTLAEVKTNKGRIDAMVETDSHIYLFEFKLFDTAQSAMDQIRNKNYYEKYLGHNKPITLVGASFDPNTRNLGEWLTQSVMD